MTDEQTQVGKPPDAEEKLWIDLAGRTMPDKSIERLDTHGKYLFSVVSIVSTLLTGFGIFSGTGVNIMRNPWLLLPVALACLSLALSMMGLTPKLDRVKRNDIDSVRTYYNKLVVRRGRYIFWAGITFSLCLLSGAVVLGLSLKHAPSASAISVALSESAGTTKMTAKIDMQDLPSPATAETEIVGYRDSRTNSQYATLFKDITHTDLLGKITISAQLDQAKEFKWFIIRCKIKSKSGDVHKEEIEVRR